MNRETSPDNQKIAYVVDEAFGGDWVIDEYPPLSVSVLRCPDKPHDGLTSFSTIGLSDLPLPGVEIRPPLGVEIVAVSQLPAFAGVLADAARQMLDNRWPLAPGIVLFHVISARPLAPALPHLLLIEPSLWADQLNSCILSTKTVAWLLGVPVSDAEADYVKAQGATALKDRFRETHANIFDPRRPSTV